MNNLFTFTRFKNVVQRDVYSDLKTSLIALGAMFAVLAIVHFGTYNSSTQVSFSNQFYIIVIMIAGVVSTSSMFSALNDSRSALSYLTLPGSTLEKYLSKLIISSIGFFIAATLVYEFSALFAALIWAIFGGNFHPALVNPFSQMNLYILWAYFTAQSVFLFGAVYFRRHSLIKTVVTLFTITLALSILALIFLRIVFFDKFIGMTFEMMDIAEEQFNSGINLLALEKIGKVVKNIVTVIVAPFFWVLGIIRLGETEA